MSNLREFQTQFSKLLEHSNDPLLAVLPEKLRSDVSGGSKSDNIALALLKKTSLSTERIELLHDTKIEHKSLLLQPASNAEDRRQVKAKKEHQRREAKRKPRPLSAKEKRASGLFDIPKEAQQYLIYVPLNQLWSGYIREILKGGGSEAKLLKADYHGAVLTVVKCSCPSFVFLTGIVIKETRHTFVICTRQNAIKTIPKKCTVFEFLVDLAEGDSAPPSIMRWEIYGEHFGFRAAERVGKKFKGKSTVDF